MSTSSRIPAPMRELSADGSEARRTSPRRSALVAGGVAVLVGLAVYLVGLPRLLRQPGGRTVGGTPLSSLSLPLALAVAPGGPWAARPASARRPGWRGVD